MSKKYKIYCNHCQRYIGLIEVHPGVNGQDRVQYLQTDGLISARKRFDGHWGFQCEDCQHYSIVASTEVDDIMQRSRLNAATRTMLREVVAKRKTKVVKHPKGLEVDDFRMDEVK